MVVTLLLYYVPEDKSMARELQKHLRMLERNQRILLWDAGTISPGSDRGEKIKDLLDRAEIILPLISASFLASEYLYSTAMQRAIEQHERKAKRVIPIILRDVHWELPPLDKLEPLPDGGKPISTWRPHDKGYTNVVDGINEVVEQWNTHHLPELTEKRRVFHSQFERLLEVTRSHIQPPGRANAITQTLQQLSIYVPMDVTLADLVVGWHKLSHPVSQQEVQAVADRRKTCGELAQLAAPLTTQQGDVDQAIKTWRVWRDAFPKSDDPRQRAMEATFARELSELTCVKD